MSPTLDAFLSSWPARPWLLFSLLLATTIYWRGWRVLSRRAPTKWNGGHLAAFFFSMLAIYLTLASPIDLFAGLLLQVHMIQHMLLMIVAPGLLWLSAPQLPWLRGLPLPVRMNWAAPLVRSHVIRSICRTIVHPVCASILFALVTWFWHIPSLYELALRSDTWHYVQHICFFVSGLLFWYPVVRPFPFRPRWSMWYLIPCLLLSDVSNTILSAMFVFSDQPIYLHYELIPRLWGISATDDQAAAGVIMWVPGSLAYLIPLFWIGVQLLYNGESLTESKPKAGGLQSRMPLTMLAPSAFPKSNRTFDLLRVPVIGPFLKWRYGRTSLQSLMLLVAVIMIYDGLTGPQFTPMNLSGVLPWIHWRGLLIIALLICGNVFCMVCPFMLPRILSRRMNLNRYAWPRWLRSKWVAVVLIVLFFWAYDAFSLWDSPWLTAWIAIAYFVAAFTIDSIFRDASFCKYVCPIGQFNFMLSLVSPMEVKVRDQNTCESCQTKDCIRGRDDLPGCELHLFLPNKVGNMDCTMCLDCVHACPHDNVRLSSSSPTAELWHDRQRSGIGRFSNRTDIAALAVVLTFGAFANAAGMIAPVLTWLDQFAESMNITSHVILMTVFYFFTVVLLPMALIVTTSWMSRTSCGESRSWIPSMTRYCYALIPLGTSMWAAHYSFHFLTSYPTIVIACQRFVTDLGWSGLGASDWLPDCCAPVATWITHLEIVLLDLGFLFSLYTAYRTARTDDAQLWRTMNALIPWALLITLLYALGLWIIFQPMQMRGAM